MLSNVLPRLLNFCLLICILIKKKNPAREGQDCASVIKDKKGNPLQLHNLCFFLKSPYDKKLAKSKGENKNVISFPMFTSIV